MTPRAHVIESATYARREASVEAGQLTSPTLNQRVHFLFTHRLQNPAHDLRETGLGEAGFPSLSLYSNFSKLIKPSMSLISCSPIELRTHPPISKTLHLCTL